MWSAGARWLQLVDWRRYRHVLPPEAFAREQQQSCYQHRHRPDGVEEQCHCDRAVDAEAVELRQDDLTGLVKASHTAGSGDGQAKRRHAADEEARVEREWMMQRFHDEPELRLEREPDQSRQQDDLDERCGASHEVEAASGRIKEPHPGVAEARGHDAADAAVRPSNCPTEKEDSHDEDHKDDERSCGRDDARLDDVERTRGDWVGRELTPAADAEVDKEGEDREEVEHALGHPRTERVGEGNGGAASEEGRASDRRRRACSGKDRRQHEPDRIGEERRIESWRRCLVENHTPPLRAEDKRGEVDEEPHTKPDGVSRLDHSPDVAEVALPEKEAEEENGQEGDAQSLQAAFQGTRSLPVMTTAQALIARSR